MLLISNIGFLRARAPKNLKNPYQILPDEAKVWKEFKAGSKLAFSRIYKHYIHVLFNYGHKFTNDRALVEDCIQDLFFELWESKERLRDTDFIVFYLMKALKIKIFKELKKQKNIDVGKDPSVNCDFNIISSYEEELVEFQQHQEQKEKIENVITKLSERQKEAIFLRYFDGHNFEEVAAIMSINLQSVHNLIHKAIKVLRGSLSLAIFFFLLINQVP